MNRVDHRNRRKWVKSGSYIAAVLVGVTPLVGYAVESVQDLLGNMTYGQLWDKDGLKATKTVAFNQLTLMPTYTDATQVTQLILAYFASTDCSASPLNVSNSPTNTHTSHPFTLPSLGQRFGLVAAGAYNFGHAVGGANIADMSTVHSIAVYLLSTTHDTPQANFSGVSYACVQNVTCNGGACTPASSSTVNFTLKQNTIDVAIGDPANGGVVACMDSTINPPTSAGYLIASKQNNNNAISWGGAWYGDECSKRN